MELFAFGVEVVWLSRSALNRLNLIESSHACPRSNLHAYRSRPMYTIAPVCWFLFLHLLQLLCLFLLLWSVSPSLSLRNYFHLYANAFFMMHIFTHVQYVSFCLWTCVYTYIKMCVYVCILYFFQLMDIIFVHRYTWSHVFAIFMWQQIAAIRALQFLLLEQPGQLSPERRCWIFEFGTVDLRPYAMQQNVWIYTTLRESLREFLKDPFEGWYIWATAFIYFDEKKMWRLAGFEQMLVSPAKRDQNEMGGNGGTPKTR